MIDEKTDKRRSSFWREMPILLAVAVLVAFVVRAFVLQTFYIPSQSMEHTLDLNDRVLVNKLVYDFREPKRGEILVFKAPAQWRTGNESEDFIKRVIGLPGDRIKCCDAGRLTINGVAIEEPYLYQEGGVADPPADREFEVTVPADRLWVMGDHRSASGDSLEHWGRSADISVATVPVDSVVGRAFVLFWPFSRATWLSPPSTFDAVPAGTGS
ncbi:MAG TPA: signal peptidase I [Pilimelia sp.]|nr:signal peptidase I [Pilimelia sp.]